MSWNREKIDAVALAGAPSDYAAFEAIGLSEIDEASVLDVGCFDGFNTVLKFKPYGNIARVVGIDPGKGNIDLAVKATDDKRFSWLVASAEHFDYPSDSFDVVFFSHTFQHVADQPKSMSNALRMLKPGGFIVIKAIDDSLMVSYPDSEDIMARVRGLYDESVRPFRAHTANTDRYIGSKCYSLLLHAGFDSPKVKVLYTDTAGKTLDERLSLFERITYYRKNVPDEAGEQAKALMCELMGKWKALFARDDYYFATPTVLALARKPVSDDKGFRYRGPLFESVSVDASDNDLIADTLNQDDSPWAFACMSERHLGEVMAIEIQAFPDPWAPIAYLAELRHNRQAHYVVALDSAGKVAGYIGWWLMPAEAFIAHVAVGASYRRQGLGRLLVDYACKSAAGNGKITMGLNVRAANGGARVFYRALGFEEVGCAKSYYTAPEDDGIVMRKIIS